MKTTGISQLVWKKQNYKKYAHMWEGSLRHATSCYSEESVDRAGGLKIRMYLLQNYARVGRKQS